MNNLKLITEHKDYLLLVDLDEKNPANKSLMYLPRYKNIVRFFSKEQIKKWEDSGERVTEGNEEGFFIIAHLPLNNAPKLEGVLLLPELPEQEEDVVEKMINDYMKYWARLAEQSLRDGEENNSALDMQKGALIALMGLLNHWDNKKAASKKWSDEDLFDFHLATTSTKHPLYSSFKNLVRKELGNLTKEKMIEWYKQSLSPKLTPIGFEPELHWKDTLLPYKDLTKRQFNIVDGVLQGTYKF